ncbi:uncharacterized protein N7500_004624 [Penicillium coprophilum]|uniref:uncharacterized protein n=1 Tax=Penicillium coprophilum TaxID=36646 RepID=UPI002389BCC9|nr:uncharacterized protein N7500_004624 [Penicillium coprophilum]KAJ5162794.1 hypothetical protein N7500_004624 [Penicillium coprophilum]
MVPALPLGATPLEHIRPSLSELYDINAVPDHPTCVSVVDPRDSTLDHSEYIQFPFSISQPARLNAHFVGREDPPVANSLWRPATGTFYREVRTAASDVRRLTEGKPPVFDASTTAQLHALSRPNNIYPKVFMAMIRTVLAITVAQPSAYSQFLNDLVGWPLALANTGWALELSAKPRQNEFTPPAQREAERRRQRKHGPLPIDALTELRRILWMVIRSHPSAYPRACACQPSDLTRKTTNCLTPTATGRQPAAAMNEIVTANYLRRALQPLRPDHGLQQHPPSTTSQPVPMGLGDRPQNSRLALAAALQSRPRQ